MIFQLGDKVELEWPERFIATVVEIIGDTHVKLSNGAICHIDGLRLVKEGHSGIESYLAS